jgi:hypothetical protein
MLTYTGPAYAEFDIVEEDVGEFEQSFPDRNKVADDLEIHAQNEVVVGELPSGKIKIYTDRTHSTTIEVDKQDCSIMRKKDDSIGLGFKFGGLMWGFGPEIKIGHSSGVAWKHDVQRMVAEYQELCTQFNTGRLSQEEYKFEKKGIIQRGYGYAKELEKRFKQKKDDMFREMDQGKYISLQNARFYEGCCITNQLPVSDYNKEKKMLAEREHKIREREIALREKQVAERENRVVAQAQYVQPRRRVQQRHVYRPRLDCRDVGVCNRSYNFNAVVPDRQWKRSSDSGYRLDILMKGTW